MMPKICGLFDLIRHLRSHRPEPSLPAHASRPPLPPEYPPSTSALSVAVGPHKKSNKLLFYLLGDCCYFVVRANYSLACVLPQNQQKKNMSNNRNKSVSKSSASGGRGGGLKRDTPSKLAT